MNRCQTTSNFNKTSFFLKILFHTEPNVKGTEREEIAVAICLVYGFATL